MKILRSVSVIILVIVLASCESKTFLRSKKKIESDLQGHWRPIVGTSTYGTSVYDQNIQWYFDNGEVKIVKVDGSGNDQVIDHSTYSVDTKIDNFFVDLAGFKTKDYDTTYDFSVKWTVIQLNGDILDLAGRPNNGGIVEIEFEKKK